jgi:hypothetical protein
MNAITRDTGREAFRQFCLHIFEDRLLELPLYLLTRLVGRGLSVQCQQSTKIELGCFEELDLANVDLQELDKHRKMMWDAYILQRVDAVCCLFNLTSKCLRDQLSDQLVQRQSS